jgi:hypothetical protein
LQLRLDLLRKLGELLQDLDRLVGILGVLEPPPRGLETCEQVLRVVQRFL